MTKEEITRTIKNTVKLIKQNNEINNSVIIANILDMELELNELQRENKSLKHSLEVREDLYDHFEGRIEEIQMKLNTIYEIIKNNLNHCEPYAIDGHPVIGNAAIVMTNEDLSKLMKAMQEVGNVD